MRCNQTIHYCNIGCRPYDEGIRWRELPFAVSVFHSCSSKYTCMILILLKIFCSSMFGNCSHPRPPGRGVCSLWKFRFCHLMPPIVVYFCGSYLGVPEEPYIRDSTARTGRLKRNYAKSQHLLAFAIPSLASKKIQDFRVPAPSRRLRL